MNPRDTKPYLSAREAAEFCCVSYSQFVHERTKLNIPAIHFMGKQVYRREDLIKAVEKHVNW